MLYSSADRKRFFLVPDDVVLRPGGLAVQALSGSMTQIDAEQLSGYEVPEAIAREQVQRRVAAIESLARELTAFASALRTVTAEAGQAPTPERVAQLLALAGLSEEDLKRDPGRGLKLVMERLKTVTMERLQGLAAERGRHAV